MDIHESGIKRNEEGEAKQIEIDGRLPIAYIWALALEIGHLIIKLSEG